MAIVSVVESSEKGRLTGSPTLAMFELLWTGSTLEWMRARSAHSRPELLVRLKSKRPYVEGRHFLELVGGTEAKGVSCGCDCIAETQ